MTRLFRAPLLALLLVATPALTAAQRQVPTSARQTPAPARPQQSAPTPQQQQLQTWFNELQQIGARVEAAQVRALQEPSLGNRHRALGTEIEAAVVRIDPSLSGLPQRVQQLDAQLRDAYQKRDEARFRQLAQEGQQLEARFVQARTRALAQPELAQRMKAFETDLEKRMLEIEPELPRLIERGRDLQARLQTATGQRGGNE